MENHEKLKKINQVEEKDETLCCKNNMMKSKLHAKEVKMGALAIHVKARLISIDMPLTMQERALCFTRSFVESPPIKSTRFNPSQLAYALKKEFDTRYGAVWHCIVGKSYGSYVTHSVGAFLYFSFDTHFVLLFKTQVHLRAPTSLPMS